MCVPTDVCVCSCAPYWLIVIGLGSCFLNQRILQSDRDWVHTVSWSVLGKAVLVFHTVFSSEIEEVSGAAH